MMIMTINHLLKTTDNQKVIVQIILINANTFHG
jgi:hypothetical protein